MIGPIYVLWLREMKRFIRARSRFIGTLGMPLFFLASFGLGFRKMSVPNIEVDYIQYLVPGIIGMAMLFRSMISGFSVLWDREFGFLKEIMVSPASRMSILIGRLSGGMTTALLQGVIILFLSYLFGFRTTMIGIILSIIIMILISAIFVGVGLIFASNMTDPQGFGMIMNFVVFPMFFMSGAMYPLDNLGALKYVSYLDPLTYGVDALRAVLIGVNQFSLVLDIFCLCGFALLTIGAGTLFFERSDGV